MSENTPESQLTASGEWNAVPRPGAPLVLPLEADGGEPSGTGLSIGRSESNDLVIENPSVSRMHALFHCDARTSQWTIADVGSRNGTWVDDVRVARESLLALADGARIRLGEVELRFLLPPSFMAYLDTQMA